MGFGTAIINQDEGPVKIERVPANAGAGSAEETPNHRRQRLAAESNGTPSLDRYKFSEALSVLAASPAPAPSPSAVTSRARTKSSRTVLASTIPKAASTHAGDPPLSPSATEAVNLSAHWRDEHNSPTEGPDGVVRFTYGAGLPILVCAPLRVCIIELQPGERITSEPQIGDSVRWNVTPATSGTGERIIPLLVVKPKSTGLDTNLFIPTDRHDYYIRLISDPSEYVARLAFAYPEDDGKDTWKGYMAQHPPDQPKEESGLPGINLKNLYTQYKIKGNDPYIQPVRVVDDGVKTYIEMPEISAHRESPALAIIGKDGKAEIVNYRVHESTYIVDRLFDRGALILGAGKTASRTEITRASWKKKGAFPYKDLSNNQASVQEGHNQ